MDACLVELLRHSIAALTRAVVRIVDDDLPSCVEEVPYLLLTALEDLLPELDRFRALLSLRQLQRAHELRVEGYPPNVK